MRRIVILGCAGSGKSTLARRLGRQPQLPVVHLDRQFWGPGWTWPDIPAFRARVADAIAGEAWISDGNYVLTSFDLTLPRADTIIILERARWLWSVPCPVANPFPPRASGPPGRGSGEAGLAADQLLLEVPNTRRAAHPGGDSCPMTP